MDKPLPLTYETELKTVTASDLSYIKSVNGVECLDGGVVTKDNKDYRYFVRIDDKPDLVELVNNWKSQWAAYDEFKAAEFDKNVPGLKELREAKDKAYNENARYENAMNAMMEDEQNDGVNPPEPIDPSFETIAAQLAEKYPRAAVYLRAEGYLYSNNIHKFSAGQKCKDFIAAGGDIEEARKILDNWYPEEAIWD